MLKAKNLLSNDIKVVNIGLESFAENIKSTKTDCIHLDWRPPAKGDAKLVDALFKCELFTKENENIIEEANKKVFKIITSSQPVLKGVKRAGDVVPGLGKYVVFHSGPPIIYDEMCGPMQGAIVGAILYEGWTKTLEEAEELVKSGKIKFDSNHHHLAVGPMTGIITESMPVFEVLNETYGNKGYCAINEGIGEVIRFGANGPSVINRLKWLEEELAPVLDKVVEEIGGINLKNIMAQALAMGDEMHQRNVAASLVFHKTICGELAEATKNLENGKDIVEFIGKKNEQFFLNLAMAAGKVMLDAARDVKYSTVVTSMSRNGVMFGINTSDLGYKWFTGPVTMPEGLYFPGYTEEDANPDMGDSTIVECYGIGGFAMGSAPAVVNFVGAGSVDKAMEYTRLMGEITVGKNANLPIPNMNFEGVPTGIDIRKVVETGILPMINTGMAHKKAGVGQVGAGIAKPPLEIFQLALIDFVEKYAKEL